MGRPSLLRVRGENAGAFTADSNHEVSNGVEVAHTTYHPGRVF